ncbi:MAG: hypothetical protein QM730_10605 [Anaerolineales bacterium]
MNNKFAQVMSIVRKIDHRYIQLAYFAVALAGVVLLRAPLDGGGGGI